MPSPEPSSPGYVDPVRRIAHFGELGLIAAVAFAALLFHLWLPSRLPGEEEFRAAGAVLRQESRPGDALLLYPWWTERARLFAPDALPVVGYLGSDRDSLTRFSRIWLLAQPDLPRSDLATFRRDFLRDRRPLGETRAFGPLQLSLYRNDRHRPVVFSAASSFASARVYLEAPGAARLDCPFDGTGHRCPGTEQLRVAAEWHEVLYQPRFCLSMSPPGGKQRLVVELPPAAQGDRWVLEAGIIWEYAWRTEPGLTTTRVGVDDVATGRELLAVSIPPAVEGMQRSERDRAASGGSGVRLWIESANPRLRQACVELSVDGPPPP